MFKIAVLVSGGGSNMKKLIENNIELSCVIADRPCKAVEFAKEKAIDSYIFERNSDLSKKILKVLDDKKIDLVVLAGFLSILDGSILEKYKDKIINIHPSLLPKYGGKGMHGLNVHRAVLENKEKESGCTVHYVTAAVDAGQIIMQEKINIENLKTEKEIQEAVLLKEWVLLPKVVKKIIKEREQ